MLACIRPDDCVWDIGANVGVYSELFARAVGRLGRIISFEPSPTCAAILQDRLRHCGIETTWEIAPIALSNVDGQAWLSVAAGDTAPSNHLASRSGPATVSVTTAQGDSLLAAGYEAPAVIKIDVEGFEGEVLNGMTSILAMPSLRAICMEVHFAALNERGKKNEPTRIVEMLRAHAFTIKWVDISHFVARR
jgi:FkbM family methyltransferase